MAVAELIAGTPFRLRASGLTGTVGALIGAGGWRLLVNKSADSRALLNKLVPTVVVLSFIPDVLLLATDAMPSTSTAAVLSLMFMHLVTAVIVVAAYRRSMPTS